MQTDKQTEELMHEMQILEQNLQQILMEKQAIELDLNESSNAMGEVRKTKDDVYQILGGIMLKAGREELIKSLEEKNKLSELRIKSIENQEKNIQTRVNSLRTELTKLISSKKEGEKKK